MHIRTLEYILELDVRKHRVIAINNDSLVVIETCDCWRILALAMLSYSVQRIEDLCSVVLKSAQFALAYAR